MAKGRVGANRLMEVSLRFVNVNGSPALCRRSLRFAAHCPSSLGGIRGLVRGRLCTTASAVLSSGRCLLALGDFGSLTVGTRRSEPMLRQN